ncbi:hypothetical protein BST92_09710 [Nonlabens arenilitoris]|uniref:Glycosyltransferase 2-like domain-containing protein n=1 Tax=Nonlabens arenilitoris TaxID=1217969 RepID=A0A2S7UD33_9FLAO|nr:glycosyltransferase family A protein [Nonlabens arenilitoris]PQJ32183.1 hypothetical protein BST92_09710 [Nonlabens arenilitoris]
MREGVNNTKGVKVDYSHTNHRIIIPFYISDGKDFYKDNLRILELSLKSLKAHSVYYHKITLICNGNRNVLIEKELISYYQEGFIDELLFFPEPIGKVNAILKVLRDVPEYYVTISDGDVFFADNWDQHVIDVFKNHKKAGAVSPIPIMRSHSGYTINLWVDYFFSSKLKFKSPADVSGIEHFARSIGWPHLPQYYKEHILTVECNNHTAVVGHSHFCATYKTTVFKNLPKENPVYLLGNNSMFPYLDKPTIKCDAYRLATYKTNGFHLGNTYVENNELYKINTFQKKREIPVFGNELKAQPLTYFIKFKVISKLMKLSSFKKYFYSKKGLPAKVMDHFL